MYIALDSLNKLTRDADGHNTGHLTSTLTSNSNIIHASSSGEKMDNPTFADHSSGAERGDGENKDTLQMSDMHLQAPNAMTPAASDSGQQPTAPGAYSVQHQPMPSGQGAYPGQQQMASEPYPGQPQMAPGPYPGQPQMAPGPYPGQPQMAPGPYPGQPQMAPGPYPGQPQMAPGPYPGQPQMAPGQHVPGQPAPVSLMPAPARMPGCPPGLEYLAQLDQVLIHQQVEIAEVLINVDFKNKYVIKNSVGQQVFFATEESNALLRILFGASRGFVFHISDNLGAEVLRVTREFKPCAGCCWFANDNYCSFLISVESPPGSVIGYVRQSRSFISPEFDILNAEQECVLKIRGPWLRIQGICCTGDIDFKIMSNDLQSQVGKVSKQWGGYLQENFTQADNFGAQFPVDLDVRTKATILASTFLIDFMFFEENPSNNDN